MITKHQARAALRSKQHSKLRALQRDQKNKDQNGQRSQRVDSPPLAFNVPLPPQPPHFRELPFEELVDFLVGLALAKAIKGESIRAIVYTICIKASAWHAHQMNEQSQIKRKHW